MRGSWGSGLIRKQIDLREEDEVGRLEAEYQPDAAKLAALDAELADARARQSAAKNKDEKAKTAAGIAKGEKQREKVAAKVAERDERIAEARRRAEDDRKDVTTVGEEVVALYADPDELLKHARVVGLAEIEENEFNLNIPRYVDIHIKRYGGSAVLSHLFAQGTVSGQLFVSDVNFRKAVNALLPKGHKMSESAPRPDTSKYTVVFAIISQQAGAGLTLPFFSRLKLRQAARDLTSFGYNVAIAKIPVSGDYAKTKVYKSKQ